MNNIVLFLIGKQHLTLYVYKLTQLSHGSRCLRTKQNVRSSCTSSLMFFGITLNSALIIIDYQNDFVNGSLTVPNALDIVKNINNLKLMDFDLVVLTKDWHPLDHISFASNHPGKKPFETIKVSYRRYNCMNHHTRLKRIGFLWRTSLVAKSLRYRQCRCRDPSHSRIGRRVSSLLQNRARSLLIVSHLTSYTFMMFKNS
jgi:hypothetical protein